ncbi:MAG TPA: NAD(P)-binding domain-containing protein [Conexibacter sp.]|jgi:predicted dinucleotide-binding enzyme|nr:NAD(P)-binding domain-containing protein [Conexibacter sp.]
MEPTRVGVIGSGAVGRALAAGFAARGHEVTIGTREPEENDDLQAWAAQHDGVAIGSFAAATEGGEIVVLATKGTATEEAIRTAGPQHFAGKVVIDATNPLDHSGSAPAMTVGHTDSGGEIVQRAIPDARVVKAFNTVNNELMVDPRLGSPPARQPMFIAGDDADAKTTVTSVLADFGWDAFDVGGIEQSRQLESLCLLWVAVGRARGAWDHAFTFVARA